MIETGGRLPKAGCAWFHVMWHTYGTWLPGDARGFRDRDHRIHSSGDYKSRPPAGEHAGLHRYAKHVAMDEVVLRTPQLRREVCEALLHTVRGLELRTMVITVCRVHVHLVIELPRERVDYERVLRDVKTKSSARVKNKPSMRLWARLWKIVAIDSAQHREDAITYVRDRQGSHATTWTYREKWFRVG